MRTLERQKCPPATTDAIRLSNVSFAWPNGEPQFTGLSLNIRRGEFTWVSGPNGAGKTTLHDIMVGARTPSEGNVNVLGYELGDMGSRALARLFANKLGVGFQRPDLKTNWTVFENMTYYSDIMGRTNRHTPARAENILGRFGLLDKVDMSASTLSGGEQQKVSIGALLVTDPELLILDEPTAAMDEASKRSTLTVLKEVVTEGTTVVMIGHDLEAVDYVDRLLWIKGGIVQADTYSPVTMLEVGRQA